MSAERPLPFTAGEPSAAERVHEAIRDALIHGELAAGAMLSENELAARFGVSRTPVRAALTRLQDEGWLTIYPKRGALVRHLDATEVADLTDARLVLEIAGVSRATSAARRALATRLAPVLEAQERALSAGDLHAFVDLTIAFHCSFLEVGGNRYLSELGDRLGDRQRQVLFQHGDRLLERADAIIAEHRGLLARLAHDDPEGFAAALREHVSSTMGT